MKTSKLMSAALVTTSMLAIPMSAAASYYPADRQTYTCSTPTSCVGANHVQFDSFTNNSVVGDERPFLSGSLNGANVQDRIQVKDGDTIVVRAYVHNNADATLMGGEANTVAKNVRIHVIVPSASTTDANLVGFISADNANPGTVNDTMSLYASNAFTLSYVPGSAKFQHAADGVHQTTTAVSDSIVTSGASLGDINGCFAYSGYVYMTVKVHMPTTPVTPPVTPTTPTTPTTPKTTPVAPTTPGTTPTTLVNTGAGSVAGIFAAVAAAGAVASQVVLRRRQARADSN